MPELPADRLRYLMGVGTPEDLAFATQRGVDLFDCVLPTRHGRNHEAFVPLVGSIVSAIPPLLLAVVVGPTTVLWVLVAYVAIQQIEGNLVEPLIMQKTASLHPAAVVTVVTVLGAAFGVLGSVLAVPSAIVAAILVKELWFRWLEEARNEPNRNAGNEGTPEKPRQTVRDA